MITKTYDELFTYEALYRAHLRGRISKRDKKPLVRFEMVTLSHINNLFLSLQDGKYKTSGYSTFTVEIPKRREIQTLPYDNRIVQHVICDDLLTPYFTKRSILDNCACQKGKGMHFALIRFEKMLKTHIRKHGVNGYFLKCDILKYFPSIPHSKLKELFCSHIQDERIKNLIIEIIDSFHTNISYLKKYSIPTLGADNAKTERGIPIGNQTSQIFGMFYLNKIDRLIKEDLRVKVYSRYMDDFILVHHDKEFIRHAFGEIEKAVKALGLQFNSKTQIFPLKNGVTYLGFRYIVTPTGRVVKMIKKAAKRRLRWRARLLKKAYLDGIIDINRLECSKTAFHGHLKHGDCYKFEKELNDKLTFSSPTEE